MLSERITEILLIRGHFPILNTVRTLFSTPLDPREAVLQSTAEVALRSFGKPWPHNDVTQKQQDQQSRWWKRESKGFYPSRMNFHGNCPQEQKSMKNLFSDHDP